VGRETFRRFCFYLGIFLSIIQPDAHLAQLIEQQTSYIDVSETPIPIKQKFLKVNP